MMTNIIRALRLISVVTSVLYGVWELRGMYFKRKHMWGLLSKLVKVTK